MPSSVPFVVAEKGVARALGAKGEIPYKLVPGEEYAYADLSGPQGEFATLDYGQFPPLIFVGREVPLSELGFPANVRAPEREARHVAAIQLSCPQCGGPLDLRAPDQTMRVACPNCGSLLGCESRAAQILAGAHAAKSEADNSARFNRRVQRRAAHCDRLHAAQRRIRGRALLLGRVPALQSASRFPLARAQR